MRRHAYSRTPITMRSAESTSPASTAARWASRTSSKLASSSSIHWPSCGPSETRGPRRATARRAPRRARRGWRRRRAAPRAAPDRTRAASRAAGTARPARPASTCRPARRADRRRRARRCRCPRHTRSARSSTKGPANTDSRSNSSCSTGVSRSYDHCDQVAQRAVPGIGGAARSREHPEALRQPFGELQPGSSTACGPRPARARGARRRAGCTARRRPRGSRRRARSRAARSGPVPRTAAPRAPAAASASGRSTRAGTGRGGTDHTTSAGMPSGSRLVASTCTSGHHCSICSTSSLVVSSTCSQLSSTSSTDCDAEHLDDRLVERAVRTLLHVERGGERGGDRALVAHRARARPGARRRRTASAMVPARRCARRVLPTPPGPNNVRMRPLSSSRPASSRSRSRPTNAVVSIGSDVATGRRTRPALAGTSGGTHARSSRSSRIAASRSRSSADGSSPRSSRSVPRNCCATRSASACRPERYKREHRLPGELLAQRVVETQGVDLSHHLVVTTDAELGVDADLGRDQPQLLEPHRLGPDPLGLGELGEGVAPPLAERGVEPVEGGDRVADRSRSRPRRAPASKRPASTAVSATSST